MSFSNCQYMNVCITLRCFENRAKIKRKPNKISAFAIRKLTAVVFLSTHVQSGSRYALYREELVKWRRRNLATCSSAQQITGTKTSFKCSLDVTNIRQYMNGIKSFDEVTR
jgi:hypothetical protein